MYKIWDYNKFKFIIGDLRNMLISHSLCDWKSRFIRAILYLNIHPVNFIFHLEEKIAFKCFK